MRPAASRVCLVLWLLLLFAGGHLLTSQTTPYSIVGGTNHFADFLIPKEWLMLLTTLLTTLLVAAGNWWSEAFLQLWGSRAICLLGRMSLSLYLWHQPLLVFFRYFVKGELTTLDTMGILLAVLILSYATYRLAEHSFRPSKRTGVLLGMAFLAVNGAALRVYSQAGIVRDIPELDISLGNWRADAFEKYNDRVYACCQAFPADTGKVNVLVVGDSFARDFANILLESAVSRRLHLVYHYDIDNCTSEDLSRCDYLFYCGWRHDLPDTLGCMLKPGARLWGVGTKNFGSSNGIAYKYRHRSDYFTQTLDINPDFERANEVLRQEWGENFVDLLSASKDSAGSVLVFTPEHKFISSDGRHLTPYGAKFLAGRLPWGKIIQQAPEY